MLQYDPVRCSVLQYDAVCCVLQYDTVCCSVLQCVAVCCSVLQCVATHQGARDGMGGRGGSLVCECVCVCVCTCFLRACIFFSFSHPLHDELMDATGQGGDTRSEGNREGVKGGRGG